MPTTYKNLVALFRLNLVNDTMYHLLIANNKWAYIINDEIYLKIHNTLCKDIKGEIRS